MMLDRLAQQVANRDDGDRVFFGDHWQVPNPVPMHKPQTVKKCTIEIDGHDAANHDVPDGSGFERLVCNDHTPDAVSLGQHASDRAFLHDRGATVSKKGF